ncbi:hypothetical protein J6590_085399 [Homalodisca vitripennis]|nr:hypothetical protein J6590_085399 [Homalodisca vitripennis]
MKYITQSTKQDCRLGHYSICDCPTLAVVGDIMLSLLVTQSICYEQYIKVVNHVRCHCGSHVATKQDYRLGL